jgi:2Fe-2S ferredoxin
VTYIGADGRITTVEVAAGDSVMDGALDNNIPGIIGQCGGGCTCSTCHCYVTDPWFERLPAPHPDELELLEFALERRPQSRLSCQIKLTAELDGLTVRLPSRQLPGDDRAVDGHAEKGKS